MEFNVKCVLVEHCESKKNPGTYYDRVDLDFGKFKKFVCLRSLESEVLKSYLKELTTQKEQK